MGSKWLKASEIEEWTNINAREAQEFLPVLVKNLIRVSITSIKEISFPSGDSIQCSGYDGIMETTNGNEYIPTGKSVWEMGTSKNILEKLNKDFDKRTEDPQGIDINTTTFVFVTTRVWKYKKTKTKWISEKKNQSNWKDIKIIDANDIEAWLENYPVVSIDFRRKIKNISTKGLKSILQFWDEWNNNMETQIDEKFLLNGRDAIVEKIKTWVTNNDKFLNIYADSKKEAVVTFIAIVKKLDDSIWEKIKNNTLIVESSDAWNELDKSNVDLILIPYFESMTNCYSINNCRIMIPHVNGGKKIEDNTIYISRQDEKQFIQSLGKIGIKSGKADKIAFKTGRNLLILWRYFNKVQLQKPEWEKKENKSVLVPMLLVGAFKENFEKDKIIISQISRCKYEEYRSKIDAWLMLEDSPIRKIQGKYQIESIEEMWDYLWNFITDNNIQDFQECVLEILQTEDPMFELKEEDWIVARIYNKNPVYSKNISRGIVNSLIMLAMRNGQTNNFNILSTQSYVDAIVKEVYENSDTWQKWFSIADKIDLLVEASPQETLKAINKQLENENSSFWELFKKGINGLFSKKYYTYILLALEKLVWSQDYASQACILLAKISEKIFGDEIAISLDKSLYGIFALRNSQCALKSERRIELIKGLLGRTPDVAWRLIIQLLQKNSEVLYNTKKPILRNWDIESECDYTQSECSEQIKTISCLAVENMGTSLNRWIEILDKINEICEENIKSVCKKIQKYSGTLNSKDLLLVYDKVREIIYRYKKFPQNNKIMSKKTINLLIDTYRIIEPKNSIEKYKYLFKNQVNLFDPIVYLKNGKNTIKKEKKQIYLKREKALMEIYEIYNMKGIINILNDSEDLYEIGIIIANKLLKNEMCLELIVNLVELKKKLILKGYFDSIYEVRNIKEFKDLINSNRDKLSFEVVNALLCLLPFNAEVWEFIDELGKDVKKEYWSNVDALRLKDISIGDVQTICNELLYYERPYSAVLFIYENNILDSELKIQALKSCLLFYPRKERSDLSLENIELEVIELFRTMYEVNNDDDRLESLELGYLGFFKDKLLPQALIKKLKKEPTLFVQLIEYAYEIIPTSETETNSKMIAYTLLGMFRQLPGFSDENIDKEVFNSWMDEALKKCSKKWHFFIGQLLSYSPLGTDGIWPHEIVRDFIERNYSDEIEVGIIQGLFIQRGVYICTEGKEENKIAEKYGVNAIKIAAKWPNCSLMLNKIKQKYIDYAITEKQNYEL